MLPDLLGRHCQAKSERVRYEKLSEFKLARFVQIASLSRF